MLVSFPAGIYSLWPSAGTGPPPEDIVGDFVASSSSDLSEEFFFSSSFFLSVFCTQSAVIP